MKRLTLTLLFVLLGSAAFAGSLPTLIAPSISQASSSGMTVGGYVIAGVLSLICIRLTLAHVRLLNKTSRSVAQRKKELAYRRSVHRYYRKMYGPRRNR